MQTNSPTALPLITTLDLFDLGSANGERGANPTHDVRLFELAWMTVGVSFRRADADRD